MNFQDFFAGAGFGGGGGGGEPDEPIDNESFYKELGVSKDASAGEIKKAFHKLSRTHHPDKGGDEEKFKAIQEAFECLKDPERRELYDQGGKAAVERGAAPSGNPFFPQQRQSRPGERKGKSVKHTLKVTLEECYNGSVRKLRLGRVVIDKSVDVRKCPECTNGTVMKTIRRGPMIQQFQQPCEVAGCDKGYICKRRNTKEILEVHIPRGCADGHKLTYYEKGDKIPDGVPGDVHIILDVQDQTHVPEEIKRKGCDLYVKRQISLVEALCGFTLEIQHLDGRKLLVNSPPGEVTSPCKYDPFADEAEQAEWESISNTGCGLSPYAQAELDDVEKLKQVISKGQLRGKGIVAFEVQGGQTKFFQGEVSDVRSSTVPRRGCTLYVLPDPAAAGANSKRMMKCVPEQGLPAPSNPMLVGNLFVMLDVVFPEEISPAMQAALKAHLPCPRPPPVADDECEHHTLVEMDPVQSFQATDIPDEHAADDEDEGHGGAQQVQCQQQ